MKATKSLYALSWLLLFPFAAHAGDVPGTVARFQWDPSVTGLTSLDYAINVQTDPGYRANVLWSTRFKLGGTTAGGYAGLEDNSNIGPNLVFSVTGATQYQPGSSGSYCVISNTAVTCRLPYSWTTLTDYQFHVAYQGGQWLGVTVTNTHNQQTVNLGSILTDATSISPLGMVQRTNYLEANSPDSNCYNQPYSEAIFPSLTGNNGQYTATVTHAGPIATCPGFSGINNSGTDHTNGFGNLLRGEVEDSSDGYCMAAGNGKTNGAPVTAEVCNKKSEGQAWVFGKDGTVRLQSNLCLDVANASPSSGALVVADQCNGSASQQWVLQGNGTMIQSSLSNNCLAEGAVGAQMTVQTCDDIANNQMWYIPKIPLVP